MTFFSELSPSEITISNVFCALVACLSFCKTEVSANTNASGSFVVYSSNSLALPEDYNRHLRPSHKGPADDVEVGIHIYSIGPISEADMTMTLDMYFRTRWYDQRLQQTVDSLLKNDEILAKWEQIKASKGDSMENNPFGENSELLEQLQQVSMRMSEHNSTSAKNGNTTNVVTLGQSYAEAIWTPDLFFPDAIEILRPGKGLISDSMVLALYEDCRLFQSMRLQVKSRCKLGLTMFPMDIQKCDICVESYQYHTDDVNVMFWTGYVVLDKTRMEKYGTANFYIDYDNFWNHTIERMSFGYNYVTLCLGVKLVRKLSIYVITMYLPSISLVTLSWVGFWIDKRAIPARASLSITTILAEITLLTGTANQFPGIADLKMADLYLIVNFFFVFASLIEFAIVSYEPPVKTHSARRTMVFAKSLFKTKSINMQSVTSDNELRFRRRKASQNGKLKQPTIDQISFSNDELEETIFSSTKCDPSKRTLSKTSKISRSASPQLKPRTIRLQDNPIDVVVDMHDFSQVRNRGAKKSKLSSVNALGLPEENVSRGRGKLCGFINLDAFSKDNADEVSKWLFPLSFTVWNIAYFGIGMTVAGRWPSDIF